MPLLAGKRLMYPEYRFAKIRLRQRAKAFGIASVVCALVFISAPYLALGLASFAILFGVLSRGSDTGYNRDSKMAIVTGLIAIVFSVFIFASVLLTLKNNPEYRQNVAETAEKLYGDMYEQEYGKSISEMMDEFFAGRSE